MLLVVRDGKGEGSGRHVLNFYIFANFSHGHLPEAGREIQTELDIMEGPLAKNQPEASLRAVSQL